MRRILPLILPLLVSPLTATAKHSFFFEPGIGVATGTFTQDRKSTTLGIATETTPATGVAFLVRGGMNYRSFFGALDFTGGPLSYDPEDGRVGSANWMYLGLNIGFNAPDFPLRLWIGTTLMSRYQIKNETTVGNTTRLYKGSAIKFGGGFKFQAFGENTPDFSLNLEYAIHSLGSARGIDGSHEEKDFPISSGSPAIVFQKPSFNLLIITLSMPLDFGHSD